MNNNIGNAGRLLWAGLHALLVLTVLYPLAVTGIAQAAFPGKANGSEIKDAKAAVVKDNSVPGRPVRPSDVPADHTDGRILGFIGEPRVNVLRLDIALRELMKG
ncbi:potassium-transporting ATPase subunit C [Streptomyces sp. NPDC004520]|uniref:potassium-transporting ATPase subunit C n=1 Tax=Streptomyces sp. NPDC004520 TaxID=3364702 RepID=UPI00369A1383